MMSRPFKRKAIAAVAAVAAVGSLSLNVALGAGQLVPIQADLNHAITIVLHGQKFVPLEDDGSVLTPITYKGLTYLPLRAVAEASGLKVAWDPNTETAYLGDEEGEVAVGELEYTRVTQEYTYDNHRYRTRERTPDELKTAGGEQFEYGYVPGKGNFGIDVSVKLDYKFHQFKAKVYVDGAPEHLGKDGTGTIEITDESGVPIRTLTAKKGETVDVAVDDLVTVKGIRITVEGDRSIIGEPMVGKP